MEPEFDGAADLDESETPQVAAASVRWDTPHCPPPGCRVVELERLRSDEEIQDDFFHPDPATGRFVGRFMSPAHGVLTGACVHACARGRVRAPSARHALQWTVASSYALTCSSTADSPGVHARAAAILAWLAQRCSSSTSCCRLSRPRSSRARWLIRS